MRRLLCCGLAVVGVLVAGCYSLEPTTGAAPDVGTVVAFDVNDIGRVALGGSMGPEIAQIEGRLVQATGTEYVVAVSVVRLLRGGEQTWTGEQIQIKNEYVTKMYKREFSRGRTIAATAIGIGLTALVASRGIAGSTPTAVDTPPPGDTGRTSRRPVHPVRP